MNFVSENPEPVDDVRFLLNQVQSESRESGSFSEAETMEWLQIDESLATWEELTNEQLIAIVKNEEMPLSTFDTDVEDEDNADTLMSGTPSPHKVLEAMSILSEWCESRCDSQPEDFQSLRRMREYAVHQILDEATRKKGTYIMHGETRKITVLR